MDSFEWNKIAGAVLLAAVTVMAIYIGTGETLRIKPLAAKAYIVEGVEVEATAAAAVPAEPAGPPIEALIATATLERGADVFKKCAACHTIEKGGPNKTGPNQWGVMGAKHAHMEGFSYSDALKAKHGEAWNWETMNAWLTNPRAAIPGNKMSFAGLSKAEDRAAVMVYLNKNSDNPLPLPAVPAAATAEPTPNADASTEAAEETRAK